MASLAAALPVVPAASCPPVAAALGGAGVAPVCRATAGLTGAVGAAASQLAGLSADSVLDAVAGWVSAGAVWLLGQIGGFLATTTSVDLGASWFAAHYRTMAGLAGVVVVPLLLAGVIQAVHRQNASMLVRSVVVNVPLAILLTAVAVQLVQLGLALTDSMSSAVAQGAGIDSGHFFDSVIAVLDNPVTGATPGTPTFIVLLGSLAVVVGAFLLWVELLVRAAAVYVAVLFLPLALASLAWPAVAHWCRRLVDTLAALVLGKLVIVSVLSLAVGALAAGTGAQPGGSAGHGFADVLGGAALLALAAAAPWALFRLLPMLEAGAVGHLEGVGRRTVQSAAAPARSLAETAMRLSTGGSGGSGEVGMALASGGGGAGPAATAAMSSAGPALRSGGGGPSTGGAGVPGDRRPPAPDLGPSSVERTGVGSISAPGANTPRFPITPGAREAWEASLREDGFAPDGTLLDPAAVPTGARSDSVRVVGAEALRHADGATPGADPQGG